MPSEYSPKLRLELIGAGEQAGLWGATTNKNLGQLLEQAIAGVTTVDLSGGGTITLTTLDGAPDQARSAVIKCIGAPAAPVTVVIPTQTKLYVFRNDCGQTITVKTALQFSGVTLLNGEATLVFCDGTNAIPGIATAGAGPTTVANGGTGTNTFVAGFIKSPSPGGTTPLTSVAAINIGTGSTDITGVLPVGSGGTGASTLLSGRVLLGNGGSTPTQLAGAANNDVLTWDSGLNTWKSAAATGAGVTTITGSNIGVSPSTGNVTITLSSANVTNALGYTPYSSANPSGYITSSALSGYAQTSSANTFTQNQTINTGGTSILYMGGSTQGLQWTGSQLQFGILSGTYMLVQSGQFLTNTDNVFKPTAGSWLGYSDQRLKENIVDYTKGLDAVKALRPVNYNFKDELGDQTNRKTYAGLIAQEVEQTTLANMIGEGPNGYKSLDSSELTYTLINAVKELSAQVDALKAEVTTLKGA